MHLNFNNANFPFNRNCSYYIHPVKQCNNLFLYFSWINYNFKLLKEISILKYWIFFNDPGPTFNFHNFKPKYSIIFYVQNMSIKI